MQTGTARWRLTITVAAVTACGILSSSAYAATPHWNEWETANSVAQRGQWLVVRQPHQGFCYIKQGYAGDSDKMDLSMQNDGIPYLTTPFPQGIQGEVTYQVDNGSPRTVSGENITTTIVKLSPDVVPDLRRGLVLRVSVKPDGRRTFTQDFDLRGFTAASNMLGSAACQERVSDQYNQ